MRLHDSFPQDHPGLVVMLLIIPILPIELFFALTNRSNIIIGRLNRVIQVARGTHKHILLYRHNNIPKLGLGHKTHAPRVCSSRFLSPKLCIRGLSGTLRSTAYLWVPAIRFNIFTPNVCHHKIHLLVFGKFPASCEEAETSTSHDFRSVITLVWCMLPHGLLKEGC